MGLQPFLCLPQFQGRCLQLTFQCLFPSFFFRIQKVQLVEDLYLFKYPLQGLLLQPYVPQGFFKAGQFLPAAVPLLFSARIFCSREAKAS